MTEFMKRDINIGKAIRHFRRAYEDKYGRNMAQIDLAIKLGVSRQTVSNWETNASNISADKLTTVCSILDISFKELLDTASKPEIIGED